MATIFNGKIITLRPSPSLQVKRLYQGDAHTWLRPDGLLPASQVNQNYNAMQNGTLPGINLKS
jgi:hypothetical protein